MIACGQLALLIAFVASGYAAFACLLGGRREHGAMVFSGVAAAVASFAALSVVAAVLAYALLAKDFRLAYVAQYSSRLLPWHYSLSAFWVGQAGSLLLWAWLVAVLALVYRLGTNRAPSPLREPAFGLLMAYLSFLVATMVFAADPMQPSLATRNTGDGLSPLLQHPAMLIHPPIVFLGYAGWAVPFALAAAALVCGRFDAHWVQQARPWSLLSWVVLGIGILVGGLWAYEELGWGGYWGWDPVENGSLIPWLTGTALIHCALAWQHRGALKKTTLLLAVATFGFCNFASFLTRSGIFSSLHAFSESPIGWLFLALMLAVFGGGAALVAMRRRVLVPQSALASVWSREALVLLATLVLLALTTVTLVGTLAVPLSDVLFGSTVVFGPGFYNSVLMPTGLLLLAMTGLAPLSRWGGPPLGWQKKMTLLAAGAGAAATVAAVVCGVRHPVGLAVAGLATAAVVALAGTQVLALLRRSLQVLRRVRETHQSPSTRSDLSVRFTHPTALIGDRRRLVGLLMHLGFVCLAVGVTGSSLGTRQHEAEMAEGETVHWAGRSIRFVGIIERDLPSRFEAEAQLEISEEGSSPYMLLPAQHLHRPQNEWTTEVAIRSTWSGDFYAILHGGLEQGRVSLTFRENPMMRWLWSSGWIIVLGAVVALGLAQRRSAKPPGSADPHHPHVRRHRTSPAHVSGSSL